ncbi:winged helix-turn-helix domain-containing protein [Pseudoalteromonas sp. S16_S37]|uniref:winged helix-turn-helix domain-containing protein n=1 Tax=Pseudoalteromonas sp. S16_S37 TaxID=2720228 RepID=UPI0016814567|nr:winged helix-turn-helix domain-containing protein [Pseudoalteromonas sp. S16_S37]MBD1580683.1 hypothetical protein [Pseudoalteromonas sp. S16_S37]
MQPAIFYIQDFKIDLSQSLIVHGEQHKKVEPKVLKVLYVLAQHRNEVVTHQALMEQVWQGAEVVPNALQRCIAILRKELGDDAKSPKIIATHPKIGYRLLSEVTWQPAPCERTKPANKKHLRVLKLTPATFGLVFSALLLLLITLFWLDTEHIQYTKLSELTRTDAHESHAIYSPNAQYVVFNRYAGSCKSHIWAKELATGKEVQLSADAGQFGAISFTSDGRELVFAAHNECDKTQTDTQARSQCWALATLDFAQALSNPQTPHKRYQCQAQQLTTSKALANHQYAFLQFDGSRYSLMHYNDLNKANKTLYSSNDHYIYHFDHSAKHQQFALFAQTENAQTLLILLDEQGTIQQQIQLKNASSNGVFEPLKGIYSAKDEHLLAVNGGQLFKISFNGQVSEITTPSSRLVSVAPHPDKQTLVAVQGSKDIDLALIDVTNNLAQKASHDLHTVATPYPSLARTPAQERLARFAPNEQSIVFVSNSTGNDELWLWHNNRKTQLTANLQGAAIKSFAWSAHNNHIAWANNGKLAITDLAGNSQSLTTQKRVYRVLNWVTDNTLLVLINNTANTLYLLDIKQNQLTSLDVAHVQNAWLKQNLLIYSTTQGEVFSRLLAPNHSDAIPLKHLNGNALLVKNEFIYSVDKKSFALNQYDLTGNFIKPITQLKPTAWKVTDIKDKQLLLEQFIAIEQEVVLLE